MTKTKTKSRLWATVRALFMVKPFQSFKGLYDYYDGYVSDQNRINSQKRN